MKFRYVTNGILILLFSYTSLLAQNFQLHQIVVSSGGGRTTSPSFTLMPTIAQPMTGNYTSANFKLGIGFWNEYVALKKYFASGYAVADGWNLISVPKTVADYRKNTLFPTAVSNAFAYSAQYLLKDTLVNGSGYWLKFSGAQLVSYAGVPRVQDTVAVATSWNIIGSIGKSVSTASITQIPANIVASQYFGFNGMYSISSTIEPGKAYWVKTSNAGKLALTGSAVLTQDSHNGSSKLEALNMIRVETKKSVHDIYQQKLWFGKGSGKELPLEQFEMPPSPPNGVLDARFGSNRFVELLPEQITEPKEIPLLLHGNAEPLTLSWIMNEESGMKYSLLEKTGSVITSRHRLASSGSITIRPDDEKKYMIRVERIPARYQLYQNYPNPFNPTTTIRFDIPQSSTVTLKIFNVLGQEVASLFDQQGFEEGQQTVEFDASKLPSGAYFYRLVSTGSTKSDGYNSVRKMLLVR